MDPLEARNLFPLVDHYIHMNHAGVSPMSQRGRAAIEQVVDASMNRPYRDGWAQDEAANVGARIHRDFVRLSPHFYNTVEEVDRVLDVLARERVAR
jgi:selenocysteine lyase/cysteine desulfurase